MISIRVMTALDLPLGMRLKLQASWNQTEADWKRFLALEPAGCFVAELDGRAVGTATSCIFGSVAWIAMILVDAEVRGQGIGKALMQHALAFLESRGVRGMRLDATSLGQPLYEKLGFMPEYQLARFEGTLPRVEDDVKAVVARHVGNVPPQDVKAVVERHVGNLPPQAGVEPARLEWLPSLVHFDREITGTDRGKLLSRLVEERPEEAWVVRRADAIAGYLTVRSGSRALQIGPCLADAQAGPLLFAHAFRQYAGQPAFLDIPNRNKLAVQAAEAIGLKVQRTLLRMCRGEVVRERVGEIWASSGPEKG